MVSQRPIIYVQDDQDDLLMFTQALADGGFANEVINFKNTADALQYLENTTEIILLILCDINLRGGSGLDFKITIDTMPELRRKSIPFIFFSSVASMTDVDFAFGKLTVQGFFQKPGKFSELTSMVKIIVDYWQYCRHPNLI